MGCEHPTPKRALASPMILASACELQKISEKVVNQVQGDVGIGFVKGQIVAYRINNYSNKFIKPITIIRSYYKLY